MEKITTEEVMDKLDMFQSRFGIVRFRKNFRRYRYASYLNIVQRVMPNSHSSFYTSGSGTPGYEQISQSDMDKLAYNCTLSNNTS